MRAQQGPQVHWLLEAGHLLNSTRVIVTRVQTVCLRLSMPECAQGQRTSLTGTAQKGLWAMLQPGISLSGGVTQCFLLYSGS